MREKKVSRICFGPSGVANKIPKIIEIITYRRVAQKSTIFSPDAAKHTFLLTLYVYRYTKIKLFAQIYVIYIYIYIFVN